MKRRDTVAKIQATIREEFGESLLLTGASILFDVIVCWRGGMIWWRIG